MAGTKKDIFNQLQKDILISQGFKGLPAGTTVDIGLGPIEAAFPNACFPTGAVHEFLSAGAEHTAATSGFVTGLLAGLMKGGKACIWISKSRTMFPPSMKFFGVEPEQVIFVDLHHQKDVLWAMEEALKCEGLAAVVGEIQEINFTDSRRLQLAVEQSRVTGFILRHNPRNLNTIACVSRWRIIPLPSELEDNMPGVGYPRWSVSLLKIRNGQPGSWQLEWSAGSFQHIYDLQPIPAIVIEQRKKTG